MNNLLLGQTPEFGVKQNQNLLLSLAMQQAFRVLQMPIIELEEWLKNEIEQNPVLEYAEDQDEMYDSPEDCEVHCFEMSDLFDHERESHERSAFHEPLSEVSLFEHLMVQAKMSLSNNELELAEIIIGNLDERGFLCMPLLALCDESKLSHAEAVLEKIQHFDPPGIAANSLKQSLLLQLKQKGKEQTLAYALVDQHFEDLIHNRLPLLHKKLDASHAELHRAIFQEIANLDLHPAARFREETVQPIVADLILLKEEHGWSIEVNEEALSIFRVAPIFLETLESSHEKSSFRKQIAAANWLQRILERRKKILKDIGNFLVKRQADFLSGETSAPLPLTMQELAVSLQLHPSTIVRAVAHKYALCNQGLFPLRSFFTHASIKNARIACRNPIPSGVGLGKLSDRHKILAVEESPPFEGGALQTADISPEQIQEILCDLINKEDKRSPLSDQALSRHMQRLGLSVARRTVTKHRRTLKIAAASHRRRHF